ncbi:lipid II:glycine glycyltransferase FemX [Patescibacteria group bacterium]
MELTQIQENQKKEWDEFVKNSPNSAMQQTYLWGKFQESIKRKTYYLVLKGGEKTLLQAIVVKHPLPFGKSYFYIPRGPITVGNDPKIFEEFFNQLGLFARKENAIFVRFDPAIPVRTTLGLSLQSKNYHNASGSIHQPENTLVLDLTKDEETLLKEMKSKTRYNIRLAKRKGVEIKQIESEKDIQDFLEINQITAKRDKFQVHDNNYYHDLLKFFKKTDPQIKLLLAKYQGKIIAAIMLSFYNQTATYLHGASSDEHRNMMAPHLLQWAGIKISKQLGYKKYDFWGIAPSDKPNHSWSGITRFKKGFGGKEINYIPTREFVYNKLWYGLIKTVRKFKK